MLLIQLVLLKKQLLNHHNQIKHLVNYLKYKKRKIKMKYFVIHKSFRIYYLLNKMKGILFNKI